MPNRISLSIRCHTLILHLSSFFVNHYSPEEPEKDIMDEFLEQSARSLEQGSSSQPQPEQGAGQSHDPEDGDHDDDDDDEEEGRLVIAQETEEEENTATPRMPAATLPQRSPPPLIKHESPSR